MLMIGLGVCFTIQQIVIVHQEKPYDAYLALSGYGMKSWHLWELFTYQLLHTGWIHFLFNLTGLWFIGRAAEAHLGTKRFLLIYFGASFAGAVLQGLLALSGFLMPESLDAFATLLRDRFGGPAAGSSVGLCGVFAALCRLHPERKGSPLSLIPIKPGHVLWIALGVAVIWIIVSSGPDLALVAHLGGLCAGASFVKLGKSSGWPVS